MMEAHHLSFTTPKLHKRKLCAAMGHGIEDFSIQGVES
jgi:hypothetical protein